MVGLLVSFVIALIVLYKLYSMLGYHDETKKKSNIKTINAKEISAENSISTNQLSIEQLKIDQEVESQVFRNLDNASQENLKKILEELPIFSVSSFIKHSDILYSKMFQFLKADNDNVIKDDINEYALDKLIKIKNDSKNRTLVSISSIRIQRISLDESNNATITTEIHSKQMVPHNQYTGQFVDQNLTIQLSIGTSDIKNHQNIKWIVLDFDKL